MISFSQYLNKISQNFINESYKIITNVQSLDEFFNESNEFGLGAQYTAVDDKEIQDYLRKRSANKLSKSERYKMPYIHKSNVKIVDEENNLYDTEALKTLIKQRPIKLLKQNEKVSHSGGLNTQYYNIGLPALRALAINEKTDQFVIVNTCPGAGMCKVFCYARKGGYVQWKNSSLSQTKIVNFLLNDPEGFKNQLIAEISTHKVNKSKKETQVAIRWHDAGDFFSDQYLKLAFDVAKAFPDIQFYAYTKMASVASADKPKNFINLERVRKIFNVDRRISVKEFLEVAFADKDGFEMKDDLLESEWEKFMEIHAVDHNHYQPVKNFFKAFITDTEVREIVKSKQLARFHTCASFDFSDYERLNGFRATIPQYVNDYAYHLTGI